eukprot:2743508-Heterocapsa_arctica.AAC.1
MRGAAALVLSMATARQDAAASKGGGGASTEVPREEEEEGGGARGLQLPTPGAVDNGLAQIIASPCAARAA